MKVIYTDNSIISLEELIYFLINVLKITPEKASNIKSSLFDRADRLSENPNMGQKEESLQYLNENHRRIIEGHNKIIYKIENEIIYITDFYDSRQNPNKMKG